MVQNDLSRMKQRLASQLLEPDQKEFVIFPFLQWLAQPTKFPQIILNKIQQLEQNVEITWNSTEIHPITNRLTPEQQRIARSFIDFFEKKIDFKTLQQQLKNDP